MRRWIVLCALGWPSSGCTREVAERACERLLAAHGELEASQAELERARTRLANMEERATREVRDLRRGLADVLEGARAAKHQAADAGAFEAIEGANEAIRCWGEHCVIEWWFVQALAERPTAVLAQGSLVPVIENGQAAGFRLQEVPRDSIFERLGFRAGDRLLDVEGHPVRTYQDALALRTTLNERNAIRLGVDRAGRRIEKVLETRLELPEHDPRPAADGGR